MRGGLGLVMVAMALVVGRPARAEVVDLELVLAVDASDSIDNREYTLQMRGYAEAFLDPVVQKAITSGPNRAIAVCLLRWAGPGSTQVVVSWMKIDGLEAAGRFGERIRNASRTVLSGGTSISDALDRAVTAFDDNAFDGTRRVIDISGDGINNQGRDVARARDDAVRAGITINALAISGEAFLPLSGVTSLDQYFTRFVAGGPGSFVVVADGFDDFGRALVAKLAREISQRPDSLVVAAE
jgi:hypothetical protein